MGALGVIGKIIAFPFKLLFGGKKKEAVEETQSYPSPQYTPQYPATASYPTDTSEDNLKAKVDLMLAQFDGLKLEYEAINQRIQNIERMVRELYTMAKS